ncbi:MAG: peptidylprolyl isomerase [Clostridia bacterium]|nr:peptidylprolyl isomerase [Clostridia bacterium]
MLCSLACAKGATPSAAAAESTETKEETNVDKTHPIATITMKDGGVIELELYPEIAPESVKNFISLANSGFYDGLIFHRVIAGFMIQGGDPDGRGTGGPGYSIKGEFSANGVKNDLSHLRGVISMARAQAFDSAGSQFFICHADSQFLDGQYAAFGKVTSGLDVVDRIAKTTTDSRDKPYKDQIMETVRVETWGVEYGEPEKLPGK